jgi:hypothetical protein
MARVRAEAADLMPDGAALADGEVGASELAADGAPPAPVAIVSADYFHPLCRIALEFCHD